MDWKKSKHGMALAMAACMCFSGTGVDWTAKAASNDTKEEQNDAGVYKVEVDAAGNIVADNSESLEKQKFSWDNATVYFVLTDRFKNGDTSNDHSYGRGLQADGKTPVEGLDTASNPGTFHGGDLKGITEKVEDGYFNDLGVNAIWITAPYEQIHGYTSGNVKSNNANTYPDADKGGFPYYSYHGYWTLDYSNIDENMGTEKDFENFVDACHERGIRVVMDVVMNHVGYTTMQDAQDYGFDGALKDSEMAKWKDYYYGNSTYLMGGDPEANNFWDAKSDVWAKKWWGSSFVRANYPGYTAAGGDDVHMSLCGLPDVITDSDAPEGDTPPLLQTKWKKEGRDTKEQAELDDFFKSTGYKKQARYYIIKWLTDWVREYGVDGFRCDTAKHVQNDAWKDLKTESVKALKEWRTNNPNKPGAKWTDDFWMTGEAWGHGMDKSAYYTDGGFDSMINFSFPNSGTVSGMQKTYQDYADTINSDPDFNSLSYVASHDDSKSVSVLTANATANKNIGSLLLLAPGGVQIYYGNEVNRQIAWKDFFTGSDYLDQRYRSDMDWKAIASDSETKDVLAHWQKVGSFRNKHLSVGAGQHEQLAAEPYTFSRTYNLEEDDEDKVVVCAPGKKGTFEVSVGDVFEDGETVTDYYSGEKYEVSGGTVSATCDENGLILLEGSGIVKASVGIKSTVKTETYKNEVFNVTLKANKAKDTYYQIDDGNKIAFTSGDVITLGGGTAYGEKTTITVTGISEDDGSELKKTATYQRTAEPEVKDMALCIKVKKSDYSTAPQIWVYTNDKEETCLCKNKKVWPGDTMEEDSDSEYWSYAVDDYEGEARVILIYNGASNKGTSQPGDVVQGTSVYDKASGKYTQEASGEAGKVTINYEDTDGNVIKSIYRVGVVGKKYSTAEAVIDGYTLTETPKNSSGTIEKETTVTYVYKKDGGSTVVKTPTPSTAPTSTPKGEITTPTQAPVTTKPSTSQVPATKEPVIQTNEPELLISTSKTGTQKVNTAIKISVGVKDAASDYEYLISVKNNKTNKVTELQNIYSGNQTVAWKPTIAGNYTIMVTAKSVTTGKTITASTTFKIAATKFTVNKFSVTKSGKIIKMSSDVTPANGTVKYQYVVMLGKKKVKTYAFSTKGTKTLKVSKKGTYKVIMVAKDKTMKVTVSKKIKL